ncbi:unnamed protein product, partial [Rotaria sp. Silwood2]
MIEAQRLLKTVTRKSSHWLEVNRLSGIKFTSVEEDLLKSFSNSELARDAHVWLTDAEGSTPTAIRLSCHPDPVLVDFGVALCGI